MPRPTLISLGSINMDFQMRTKRWPDAGETLTANEFLMTAGGKAANVAVLARRLGADTLLIGHVGDDPLADIVLRQLGDEGIDTRHVARVPGTATAISTIVVRPDGDKTILLAPNANEAWDKQDDVDAIAEAIAAAPQGSALVVDLEIPVPVVRHAANAARERGFPVVLDPSPADRFSDDLIVLVDVITPNPSEGSTLTGIDIDIDSDDAAERSAHTLHDRGVAAVCQKLGHGGCVVVTQDGTTTIPAVSVDVIDKTGAGDAFAGGLGVALLEDKDIVAAAASGVATSSLAVTAYGSQQSYPSRDAFDRMLERIENERRTRTRSG